MQWTQWTSMYCDADIGWLASRTIASTCLFTPSASLSMWVITYLSHVCSIQVWIKCGRKVEEQIKSETTTEKKQEERTIESKQKLPSQNKKSISMKAWINILIHWYTISTICERSIRILIRCGMRMCGFNMIKYHRNTNGYLMLCRWQILSASRSRVSLITFDHI